MEIILLYILALSAPTDDWNRLDSLELELSQVEYITDGIDHFEFGCQNESEPPETGSIRKNASSFERPTVRRPFSIDLRLYYNFPAFVKDSPHSSTWQGGAESATGRLKAIWGNWRLGATFDKDAYEPRWDDLIRCSLSRQTEHLQMIVGDFNATFGQGVIFWNRPVYGTTSSFMAFSGHDGFRLTGSTNTSVNNALRGVGVKWNNDWLQILATGSNSRYDATRDSYGNILRMSDGGYHRSPGEEVKRGSLEERLAGVGGYAFGEIATVKIKLGLFIWEARYFPELRPAPSYTDPYPMTGDRAGAIGINLGGEWQGIMSTLEICRDIQGIQAVASQSMLKIPASKTRIKVSIKSFPARYENPHSAAVGGRDPQGLSALGVVAEQPFSSRKLKSIVVTATSFDYKFPALGDAISKDRSEASIEGKGTLSDYSWRLRYFLRRDTRSDPALNPERTVRIRGSLYHRLSSWGQINGWGENARSLSELGERLHGWAVGSIFRAKIANTGNLDENGELTSSTVLPEIRVGCTYFETIGLPIYGGEISYPDRTRIVRLDGTGIRLSTEILISPYHWGIFSLRTARTYPLKSGTKGDGELYLSVTIRR